MRRIDWSWVDSLTWALWCDGLQTKSKLIEGLKVIGNSDRLTEDQVVAELVAIKKEENCDKVLSAAEVQRLLRNAKREYRKEKAG